MTAQRHPFEYAVLRAVPRVDRGEAINAGVIVYCQAMDYLGSRVHLDRNRLLALDPYADVESVALALDAAASCALHPGEDLRRRFVWLTAPRSTVIQPGPVHTGLTANPSAETQRLFDLLVAPPAQTRPRHGDD